jgi:hypothetical protein
MGGGMDESCYLNSNEEAAILREREFSSEQVNILRTG